MLALLALAASALSACTPAPEPTPTPTAAFASEEEAFAAAEEVYRAYNDALNAHRTGDDDADPYDYLTGKILDSELKTAQELEATGIHIVGPTKVVGFEGRVSDHSQSVARVVANVCLDITEARAIDDQGTDVTAADRSDTYTISVELTGAADHLLISEYEVAPGETC
ncbi:hypothetical protein GCM10007269_30300 [Microbacterium murale]|uniref:SnoaL-like domain-containing protein n=2 Tax=Microbacterium murale TaxID=1081040 RepID=A0ABQ1S060_9MICO|nr:hypothetical protein GCM10007269_30300 [Microbacterium murale]